MIGPIHGYLPDDGTCNILILCHSKNVMTLDEFTRLAKSYWPGMSHAFTTPRDVAGFVLLAQHCARQQPTVVGQQWVAELAAGAMAQAVQLRAAEADLDAAHMYLLELEDEYDPVRIEALWSEIKALMHPYLQTRHE